ncbi:MAG: hypothetical protein OXH90_12200 [Paracoccaceae bacterium]|nr:hypothetical protein [Paracoccaceae bacterium]MDE2917074.1 hypothetical protein [Paracoccaceae bacterium]
MKNNNNKNENTDNKVNEENPLYNEDMEWDEVDELAKMMARNLMKQPPETHDELKARLKNE